jgi:tRNA uridine 5-carboxymethylaminomethyl modification enzyme
MCHIHFHCQRYEEAAAQGIVAGANAGLAAVGRPPMVVGRDEGYIGVLIDDLITRGTNEPYRMFTSRAEYRLSLRQDNADTRLTRKGFEAGIVSSERMAALEDRESQLAVAMSVLQNFSLPRTEWSVRSSAFHMRQKDGKHKTADDVLSMPEVELEDVLKVINEVGAALGDEALASFRVSPLVFDTLEATCKYSNYLARQEDEMERWRKSGALKIPVDIDYTRENFPFSSEELENLRKYRPETLHAASQIQGITPHALIYLQTYISRGRHHRRESRDKAAVSEDDGSYGDFLATGRDHTPSSKHFQDIEDI